MASIGQTLVNSGVAVDSTDANNIYVGLAPVGTPTSAAAWQIKKLVITDPHYTIDWNITLY